MYTGIIFALLACMIWGTMYVIPGFLMGYNAMEITFMRYLFYGSLSSCIVLANLKNIFKKYTLKIWGMAFLLALWGHVLYYFPTVIALRLATPPVTILIGGLAPVVIGFYGNWEMKERQFNYLILPAIGIVLGMILVNFSAIDWSFETKSAKEYGIGLMCAFLGLIFWSLYAVKNGRFIKQNPSIQHSDWSSMLGVGAFFWVLLFLGLVVWAGKDQIDWGKYFTPSKSLWIFLLGTCFLGTVTAWVGGFFWNRASAYLPLSIAGPMMIFETIFGLTLAYLVNQQIPEIIELVGVLFMLLSITYILIKIRKNQNI